MAYYNRQANDRSNNNGTLFSSPLGPHTLFRDGPAVRSPEHGIGRIVQGPRHLGRPNCVLDVLDHVAVDYQILVESFSGVVSYEEVLGRCDAASERRFVRLSGLVVAPSVVLRRHGRGLCRGCFQRCHARHRRRRGLYGGAFHRRSGEVYRVAGSVLQLGQTGCHGWPGVAGRVALREFFGGRHGDVRRFCSFVDGCADDPVRHARGSGGLPPARTSFGRQRCRTPFAAGGSFGPERGYRGILHQAVYLVLYRLYHPVPAGRRLRDEDRASVPQGGYRIRGPGSHEPADRALLRDVRSGSLFAGFAAGWVLHRPAGPSSYAFHALLRLQPSVRGLRFFGVVPAFEHVAGGRRHRRGVLRLWLRVCGAYALYDAAGGSGPSPDGALRLRLGDHEPLGDAHGHGLGIFERYAELPVLLHRRDAGHRSGLRDHEAGSLYL